MRRATTVHISNQLFSVEEDALVILEDYLSQLRRFFENQESGKEIYDDIETHVADVLSNRMKAVNAKVCLSVKDIQEMINTVGLPSEFESQEYDRQGEEHSKDFKVKEHNNRRDWQKSATNIKVDGVAAGIAQYLSIDPIWIRLGFIYTTFFGGLGLLAYIILAIVLPRERTISSGIYKKLYRLGNHAVIAGVCAGLASYFSIPIYLVRLLFISPIVVHLFFNVELIEVSSYPLSGFLFISYVVIWILVPVAKSSADKLRMKGMRATVDSIQKEVKTNLLQSQPAIDKFWKIISYIFMTIGILIGAVILLAIVAVLCSIFLLPFFYGYILDYAVDFLHYVAFDRWQAYALLLAILLIIAIPLFLTCVWIASLIFRWSISKYIYLSAVLLWFISVFFTGACGIYTASQFDAKSKYSEQFVLKNLEAENVQLTIQSSIPRSYYLFHSIDDDKDMHFPWFISDTAFHWENVCLRIEAGEGLYYELKKVVQSRGTTPASAYELAKGVTFSFTSNEDSLLFSSTSSISKNMLFRNQRVYLTLFVPTGKSVTTDETIKLLEEDIQAGVTYYNRAGKLHKQYHF